MKPSLLMMKPEPAAWVSVARLLRGAACLPARRLAALLSGSAEEPLEQIVAAEELAEVLRPLPRLGADADDHR